MPKQLASLSSVGAPGLGRAFELPVGTDKFSLQVVHTGSPSSVVVDLMGSNDGTTFASLGQWSSASLANGAFLFVVDKPVIHVRADLTTLTGGSSPKVSANIAIATG